MKERINTYVFVSQLLFKNQLWELSGGVGREYVLQLVVQTEAHLKNGNLCEKISNKFEGKLSFLPV
jgi:hypothetical protein